MSSRADGSYTLPNLDPGRYSVVFEKTGFTRSEVPDVLVVVGQTMAVDVALAIGAVQEMVEVSAAAVAIEHLLYHDFAQRHDRGTQHSTQGS
jgi:hypothetical protein